jgi:hypothetical protein
MSTMRPVGSFTFTFCGWVLLKVLLDQTVTIREMLFQQLNIARVPVFRFVVHFKGLEIGLNRMEEITNGKVYFRPTLQESGLKWHGWQAYRRGLATNLRNWASMIW